MGAETEFYNVKLEGVKVVRVAPHKSSTLDTDYQNEPDFEDVELRYQKITWTYSDGSLTASDTWNAVK
jgi:type VI secretion system secreted protein Hcp